MHNQIDTLNRCRASCMCAMDRLMELVPSVIASRHGLTPVVMIISSWIDCGYHLMEEILKTYLNVADVQASD